VESRISSGVRYGGLHSTVDYKTTATVPGGVIPASAVVDLDSVVASILTSSGFTGSGSIAGLEKLTPVFENSGNLAGTDLTTTSHVIATGDDGVPTGTGTFTSAADVTFTESMVGKYITYVNGLSVSVSRKILAVVSGTEVTLEAATAETLPPARTFVVSTVAIGMKLYVDNARAVEFAVADVLPTKLVSSAAFTTGTAIAFQVVVGVGYLVNSGFVRLTSGITVRGQIHISYVAARHDLDGSFVAVATVDDLKAMFGQSGLVPENPLGYGLLKMISNTSELYTVYGVPVAADTTVAHQDAIDIIETNCRVWNTYFIVPLTFNETIGQLYMEFEQNMNNPIQKFAMVVLWTPKLIYKDVLVYSATGAVSLDQTKLEDPDVDFVSLGVAPGSYINVIADNGDESMERTVKGYLVGTVATHELTLASGGTMAELAGAPVNYEIVTDWFQGTTSTDKQKQAQALQAYAETKEDERFWINFPDYFVDSSFVDADGNSTSRTVDGFYANCSYVGSCIRLPYQQPLNNFRLAGYVAAFHSNNYFKVGHGKHIHIIESGGITFFTQPVEGSSILAYEQWTSNMTDQIYQYRSVIRNRDAAKMVFIKNLCNMMGRDNLTDDFKSRFSRIISVLLERLKEAGQAGPQASITRIELDPNDRTNIKVWLTLDEPYPAHTADIYFLI